METDIDERLRRIGKDRRWLAAETGYSYFSLRDALAPASQTGVSPKMAAKIESVLVPLEAKLEPAPGDILGEFTPAQRKAIAEHAAREGFGDSRGWIVAKVKALLAMLGAKPGK